MITDLSITPYLQRHADSKTDRLRPLECQIAARLPYDWLEAGTPGRIQEWANADEVTTVSMAEVGEMVRERVGDLDPELPPSRPLLPPLSRRRCPSILPRLPVNKGAKNGAKNSGWVKIEPDIRFSNNISYNAMLPELWIDKNLCQRAIQNSWIYIKHREHRVSSNKLNKIVFGKRRLKTEWFTWF